MTYKLLKNVIESGNYEKDDILAKLDTFLTFGRIDQDQYTELMGLVEG